MSNVHDVAAALLDDLGEMTTMKLQKLVYFCQAWHLARQHEPLFPEQIEAWRQGPVVRDLFDLHRQTRRVASWRWGDTNNLSPDARKTITWVEQRYGRFSAERLSVMTHNDAPWRVARGVLPDDEPCDATISFEQMAYYYGRQQADVESAVSHAVANAALEGVSLTAEQEERLRDVAAGRMSADALIAEEIARLGNE
jgi:uncharacterized phage-associated protein